MVDPQIHISGRKEPNVNKSPEMIRVSRQLLDELESGFLHLLFMANRVAVEIDNSAAIPPLAKILWEEVDRALTTMTNWRAARCEVEYHTGRQGSSEAVAPRDRKGS